MSRARWTLLTSTVAAAVALVLHYAGAAPLLPEAVGATWTTAIVSALGLVLGGPNGAPPPPPPKDGGGSAAPSLPARGTSKTSTGGGEAPPQ